MLAHSVRCELAPGELVLGERDVLFAVESGRVGVTGARHVTAGAGGFVTALDDGVARAEIPTTGMRVEREALEPEVAAALWRAVVAALRPT